MTPVSSLAFRRTAAADPVAWHAYADRKREAGDEETADFVEVILALEAGPQDGEEWCKQAWPASPRFACVGALCRGCVLLARERKLLERGKAHSVVRKLLGG